MRSALHFIPVEHVDEVLAAALNFDESQVQPDLSGFTGQEARRAQASLNLKQ